MRRTAPLATALALIASTTLAANAQRPDSSFVGSWIGQAKITVPWTMQRELAVRLSIQENGVVTGAIGDALLTARMFPGSTIARAMHLARAYTIEGQLAGAMIRAEGVKRDRVRLSLDRAGDALTGDLETSGTYEGSASELVLRATGLVLRRADAVVADRRARSNAVVPLRRAGLPLSSPM